MNYIFIELVNGQRWMPINSTYGVARLLTRPSPTGEYNEPCRIDDSFINRFMSCSTQVNPDLRKLKIGARVRILKGR